jgi:hypothetical protein
MKSKCTYTTKWKIKRKMILNIRRKIKRKNWREKKILTGKIRYFISWKEREREKDIEWIEWKNEGMKEFKNERINWMKEWKTERINWMNWMNEWIECTQKDLNANNLRQKNNNKVRRNEIQKATQRM